MRPFFISKIDVSYPDWHSCAPKVQLSLDLSMTILFKDGKNEAVSSAFHTLKQVFCYFKKKFQTYHKKSHRFSKNHHSANISI